MGNTSIFYLSGQFSSGSQDQSLAVLFRYIDLMKDRDGKGCRLAGARLGLGNNIFAYKRIKKIQYKHTDRDQRWCYEHYCDKPLVYTIDLYHWFIPLVYTIGLCPLATMFIYTTQKN